MFVLVVNPGGIAPDLRPEGVLYFVPGCKVSTHQFRQGIINFVSDCKIIIDHFHRPGVLYLVSSCGTIVRCSLAHLSGGVTVTVWRSYKYTDVGILLSGGVTLTTKWRNYS